MIDEVLIEVDQDDCVVGSVGRQDAHKPKALRRHREVMVLIYKNSNKKEFWLQKRSSQKEQYPGYWTLSATGHVEVKDGMDDEGYLRAAVREAKEELGVTLQQAKMVGKVEQKTEVNWTMMGLMEAELSGDIKIDKAEVEEVRLFDRNSVISVSGKLTPNARACLEYLKIIEG